MFGAFTSLVAATMFATTAVAASLGARTRSLSSSRDGGRTTSLGRVGLRRAVVAAQLAMATIVLVAAGLLARSYRRLVSVRPGFDPSGVVTARVTLPDALYPRGERQVRFFEGVVARLTRQSGVIAAGAVSVLPESPNFDHTNARVVGREYAPGAEPTPDVYRVTPGYFDAMRIPREAGRLFTRADDDRHPLVAVINALMARELFPGESAVGRLIWTGAGNAERTIVGVVGNTYQYGLDQKRTMQLYVPRADNSGGDLTLVARSAGDDRRLASLVRDAVRAVDPAVQADDDEPGARRVGGAQAPARGVIVGVRRRRNRSGRDRRVRRARVLRDAANAGDWSSHGARRDSGDNRPSDSRRSGQTAAWRSRARTRVRNVAREVDDSARLRRIHR